MIYTKRFISIFISICIVISCISISIFAEDNIPVEVTSDSQFFLGQFEIYGQLNNGTHYSMVDIREFLPILDQTGLPYNQNVDCNSITFNTLRISSDNTISGYFSLYMIFELFGFQTMQLDFTSIATQMMTWGIRTDSSSTFYYPKVEIGIASQHGTIPNLQYNNTFYLKWDLYADNANFFYFPYAGQNYINIYQNNWTLVPTNISIVKYKSALQAEYSDDLQDIASAITSLDSDLNNYLPQIVQYLSDQDDWLDSINSYLSNSENYLNLINQRLILIRSHVQSIQGLITSINQFILDNFAVDNTTPNSMWFLLKNIYENIANSSNNQSLYSKFSTIVYSISNYFTYNKDTQETTVSKYNAPGIFQFLRYVLNSLNSFNVYQFYKESELISSTEFQSGKSVQNSISQNGGYGSLSGFSSSASGFGNIGLIGSIFNGLSSAFRWFTNDTKNNIDAVQPNRDINETISSYLDDNLNLIQEYLNTEADPND